MNKYEVYVSRRSHQSCTEMIEAEDINEAWAKAEKMRHSNHDFEEVECSIALDVHKQEDTP